VKKTKFTIITISLLLVGIVSGLLILFDYVSSPHLILKEQAFAIAIKAGNWSQNFLSDKIVDEKMQIDSQR
jgi:hypothetical protein